MTISKIPYLKNEILKNRKNFPQRLSYIIKRSTVAAYTLTAHTSRKAEANGKR
jgi:hypothetical protein